MAERIAAFDPTQLPVDSEFREGFALEFLGPHEITADRERLIEELAAITADARNDPLELMRERLQGRVGAFDGLILIHGPNQEAVAYAGYDFLRFPDFGTVLYESAKMTRKGLQGKGLGRRLTQIAVKQAKPNYFSLRTQNPAEILSVKRALYGTPFAPLDMEFDAEMQIAIPALAEAFHFDNFDPRTGVCQAAYKNRVGDFVISTDHPEIGQIERKLTQLGMIRERGDGIVILARISPHSQVQN